MLEKNMQANRSTAGDYLTVDDIATALQITRQAIWTLRRDGDFPPALRLGRRMIRFRRDAVERWIESRAER